MRKSRVGRVRFANAWRSTLKLDRSEWQKFYHDFINDGLSGWTVKHTMLTPEGMAIVTFDLKPNLVVNSGVDISMGRLFNIDGPPGPIITMGVDDGASNPTATTSSSSAGSTSRRLVAFDSTPTYDSGAQKVTSVGTFTNSNVAFGMKRLFLSKAVAGTTDSAGDLYAMTNVFSMDLTSFSSWSQTFQAETTGAGS